jgi:hypothetical protein
MKNRLGFGIALAALLASPALTGTAGAAQAQTHNCDFCHDVHGGVTSGTSALNRNADIELMCVTCHGDGGIGYTIGPNDTTAVSTITAAVHDHPNYTTYPAVSCWQCHGHGSDAGSNLSLIRSSIDLAQGGTGTVTFTANASGSDFTGAEGICTVCHTEPGPAANSAAPGHQSAACSSCHQHSDGFPTVEGGLDCTVCHSSEQLAGGHAHPARRNVSGTGGDFERASNHLTGAYGAEDCEVCHDQVASHDTDTNGVLLFDHTSAAAASISITHGVDPALNATEAAKLETFCLGCHANQSADNTGVTFPAGSSASAPFSGLVPIPAVDGDLGNLWNDGTSSAHQIAPSISGGCYGDGAFGCHGNGHGSQYSQLRVTGPTVEDTCVNCHDSGTGTATKLIDMTTYNASSHGTSGAIQDCADCHAVHGSGKSKLFTPDDGVLNGTTLYEQEEGFCFTCHDGGTASTDILSQFNTAINWTQTTWGAGGISTFNDRHDVSHDASSVSGAKIECVACHNAHGDNSTQQYNPDPDPDNAAPTWTLQTDLSAFCVDCHDGTLPTGVQDHTEGPMTDVGSLWASTNCTNGDGHGECLATASFRDPVPDETGTFITNPWFEGVEALPCEVCHRAHPKTAAEWGVTGHQYDFFSLQDSVPQRDTDLSDGTFDPPGYLQFYWEGTMRDPPVGPTWEYSMSEDGGSATVDDPNAGGYFCNSCHVENSMDSRDTCGSGTNCHSHGGKF